MVKGLASLLAVALSFLNVNVILGGSIPLLRIVITSSFYLV